MNSPPSWEPLVRIVFDPDRLDRLPLYVDVQDAEITVEGPRSGTIRSGAVASFATYFNAFPAWYWCEHTVVSDVELALSTVGSGTLTVHGSDANGVAREIASADLSGASDIRMPIGLEPYANGGWLWFDLAAGAGDLQLISAEWRATGVPVQTRRGTLSITTMDKPDFCLGVLERVASDAAALAALDQVLVIDQGQRRVRDDERFPAVDAILGRRLRVIEQPNLGGSGGFSRGMLETLESGSGCVILLDDDVEIEPESIRRLVVFASLTTEPMIVGGHMFDLNRPLTLHALSEGVSFGEFDWGPIGPARHDFGARSLRESPWMHRPTHPDYNGWWFCLIPSEVIRTLGCSLPLFLKWDDAEYGLRAKEFGIRTVSLPGAAVWHVSWLDKNDSLGWQSFYHARNRMVAALVSSPGSGSRLPMANLLLDIRFLLTSDYHVVELRHRAVESVLRGPRLLASELGSRLADVRRVVQSHPSGRVLPSAGDAPEIRAEAARGGTAEPTGLRLILTTIGRVVAVAGTPRRSIPDRPEGWLPHPLARWWRVSRYRHVLTEASDSGGFHLHRRDPRLMRRMLVRSVRDAIRLRLRWRALGKRYRQARGDLVSIETWRALLHGS